MAIAKSKMPPKANGRPNNFQTLEPEKAAKWVAQYIPKDKVIWCCASGDGRLVKYLQELGYKVVGTDLLSGFDFLSRLNELPEFDIIIENPPFGLKDEFLARCYEIGKPFALLLPMSAMGEQGRVKMYKENGIQLIIPPERTQFITPNGKEGGAWFFCAWFCNGIEIPSQITFF